jgi:hypothetical protein
MDGGVWPFPLHFLEATENALGPKGGWKGNSDFSLTLAKSPCHKLSSKISILHFCEMPGLQDFLSGTKLKCVRKTLTMLILK